MMIDSLEQEFSKPSIPINILKGTHCIPAFKCHFRNQNVCFKIIVYETDFLKCKCFLHFHFLKVRIFLK